MGFAYFGIAKPRRNLNWKKFQMFTLSILDTNRVKIKSEDQNNKTHYIDGIKNEAFHIKKCWMRQNVNYEHFITNVVSLR